MKKDEAISFLGGHKIPHDPEAKAADLAALAVPIKNAIATAQEEGTAREIELQNQVNELEERLAAAESITTTLEETEPDEFEEAIADAVREKVAAGLSREMALEVVHAQIDHDTALHDAETEESEPDSE